MHLLRPALVLTPLLALASACAQTESPIEDLETTDRAGCRGCVWGPPVLNTNVVNGAPLPSIDTSGKKWDGVTVYEVSIGADPTDVLTDVSTSEGVLHGIGVSGAEYSGHDFIGSVWILHDHRFGFGPVETTLRVADFIEDGPRSRYKFTYESYLTEGVALPTCEADEQGSYAAVLFQDLHVEPDGTLTNRPDTLYFGCSSGAVGKAVTWGYSPWEFSQEVHQTAVRAVRGDYCGDGVSWTAAGTPLLVDDPFGLNGFGGALNSTEGLWTENGVACLDVPRLAQWSYEDIQCPDHEIPRCEPTDDLWTYPGTWLWTKPAF